MKDREPIETYWVKDVQRGMCYASHVRELEAYTVKLEKKLEIANDQIKELSIIINNARDYSMEIEVDEPVAGDLLDILGFQRNGLDIF